MEITQVIITIVLLILTFLRRDIFLYFIVSPVAIATGLLWRPNYDTPDGLVISLVLVGIGIYCMVMGIYNLVRKKA